MSHRFSQRALTFFSFLGALKNGGGHFVLIPVLKRKDVQMSLAVQKWRGCPGVLVTDYIPPEVG